VAFEELRKKPEQLRKKPEQSLKAIAKSLVKDPHTFIESIKDKPDRINDL
jgi:hypothetical protein